MNILLLLAHSIAEFDDHRMFSQMGHDVFSIGSYLDPRNPQDPKRPAIEARSHPALAKLCALQMETKSALPEDVLDWADVAIIHHFPMIAPDGRPGWISGNWGGFKRHRVRVVWRTCGQSNPDLEKAAQFFADDGLQIVRYSPTEVVIPNYAGADAMIRFGKEPSEWGGWHGFDRVVGNITQHLAQRGAACGYPFWQDATEDLPTRPAGPGSEAIGGLGQLEYEEMREYLQRIRCYLYTGTIPAPYTLGLIEAMMTGVPVVSIGQEAWAQGVPWLEGLFEGGDLALMSASDPQSANRVMNRLFANEAWAIKVSELQRARAIDLFGMDGVKAQWAAFLG